MDLDDTRKQILAASGHLLIKGGPGCGKTTIALRKAATRLETLAPEQRVLFLSFSRAAVRQIADRMRDTITRTARNRLEVRTFHSFFLDLVRAHGPLLAGQPSSFITPERERQIRADFTDDWIIETHRLAREEGRYVFDRLAGTAATLLTTITAVRSLYSDTYPLIIVDEFQDTNDDQWQAVRALSATSTIVCLADPDQRIFDFVPGVDEKRLDHLVDHLDPTPFDLSKDNHRSAGSGLLDYANAVLRNQIVPTPPKNVVTWTYQGAVTCTDKTHRAIIQLRTFLEPRLNRTPTIAVLASTNKLVARLSDAIATDQRHPANASLTMPAVDHELNWDPELSAAAGYVVASIMEWPALSRSQALTSTLNAVVDYYRVKLTLSSRNQGARAIVTKIEKAITALTGGTAMRPKAATVLATAYDRAIEFTGDPVLDWQTARACLRDAAELDDVFKKARLLRLFKATDALAWALIDAWDGQRAYTSPVPAVRQVLTNEMLEVSRAEPVAVSLMNMHKSKGKEFDAVIISETRYDAPLLDLSWKPEDIEARRRLLRVAITRARHIVLLVRPAWATPLTS